MNDPVRHTVFISWSGKQGGMIASQLHELLRTHGHLEPWLSAQDIVAGAEWREELRRALDHAKHSLVVLTQDSSRSLYVNFEVGYLAASLGKCCILAFNHTPKPPLSDFQTFNGLDESGFCKVLDALSPGDEVFNRAWTRSIWDKWLSDIFEALEPDDLLTDLTALSDALSEPRRIGERLKNDCLKSVVRKSIRDQTHALRNAGRSFSVPAVLYPHYLIQLQQDLNVRVKAVAFLGEEEFFWEHPLAVRIMQTSHPFTERVFVMKDRDDLSRFHDEFVQHATQYRVSVTHIKEVERLHPYYRYDFSIISRRAADGSEEQLLARYATTGGVKVISFDTNPGTIADHEKVIVRLIDEAEPVYPDTTHDQVADLVFHDSLAETADSLQMSGDVPIEDYDRYEPLHPYYEAMKERMLAEIRSLQLSLKRTVHIVEHGAGTGLLTQQLSLLENVRVVAVEVDQECLNLLTKKAMHWKNVEVYQGQTVAFLAGQEDRSVDIVCSSFAEHHVRPKDRAEHYRQVCRAARGGVMIVGDEYLRPHIAGNYLEWRRALEDYHNHIIEKARELGKDGEMLATLELKALRSGLKKRGDFKVSCEQYTDYVTKAGLVHRMSEKIGPTDIDSVGGIYVHSFGI